MNPSVPILKSMAGLLLLVGAYSCMVMDVDDWPCFKPELTTLLLVFSYNSDICFVYMLVSVITCRNVFPVSFGMWILPDLLRALGWLQLGVMTTTVSICNSHAWHSVRGFFGWFPVTSPRGL